MKLFTLTLLLVLGAAPALAAPFRILVTSAEVPLVPNSVLHLAENEGYFQRAGVEVELVAVAQTPMAVAALRAGGGEMANISLEALLGLHVGDDRSLRAVGSTDKAIPYVIAAAEGVTFDSLGEQRFGVGRPNSLDHTLSTLVLQRRGTRIDRMTYLPLGAPEVRAQALMQGRIEATTMSIGVFLAMPARQDLQILVDVADYYAAAPVLTKVNVVPDSVLAERGAELDAVLTALTLAARDFAADPSLWASAMARARPDVDPVVLAELSQRYAGAWAVNGGLQLDEAAFAQTWFWQTDRFRNEAEIAIGAWTRFAPMDRVLARIGEAPAGDRLSR